MMKGFNTFMSKVAVLTLGCLTAQAVAQTMDPCNFKYFYANTGDDFANDDIAVSVAW